MQNLITIYGVVQELWAFSIKYLNQPNLCSARPNHRFESQWLDNAIINKYAKYDTNIPCGSRVMSIFTN